MNSGRIKWFDVFKNYGYISLNDGTEVYFHANSLAQGSFYGHIGAGQGVSFALFETRLGFEACNIHPVSAIYR